MYSEISKDLILASIPNKSFNNIIILDKVDSTNTYAKGLLPEKAVHETVVLANCQTNGKGRRGREFFSPPNTGIYMSIILDPESLALDTNLLTVAAGVSVCESLVKFGLKPQIKWVNDIFVNGKKVCGILAESTSQHSKRRIVLGIGLNVCTASFPDNIKAIAGAAFSVSPDRNKIISQILWELKGSYDHPDKKDLIDKYKRYSLILGKEISYRKDNLALSGIAVDINQAGNLLVALPDGKIDTLLSGEVSLGSSNFCGGGDF